MKSKGIFVSFVVLFAVILSLSAVNASDDFVVINDIQVNGISVFDGSGVIGGTVGEKVPVEITFTALRDVTDVKVKVYIEGFKNDISETSDRFHVVNGSTYVKRFTIELPSAMDLDQLVEELSLLVRITAQGEDSVEYYREIMMQRELYAIEFLSIEAPDKTVSGSTIPVDVVIKNNGDQRLDDIYVKASITELGISRSVYVGDIGPSEESDADYYENIKDSVEKRLYLAIPKSAAAGTYNIEVEAYNYDTSTSANKKVVVESVQTTVVPTVTSKTVSTNEEATFNVVLVNPNDRMVVYTLVPEEAKGLVVEVTEPVAAVPADSSKTVQVKVTPLDSAEEGTHVVTVNVNSEGGVAKQTSFSVNVKKAASPTTTVTTSNTVLILTVVLSIIFVVLLVVLIVLLTKRPAESEEFGETSYY
jgi:hypothetical protein